jgi:hypothetical protein
MLRSSAIPQFLPITKDYDTLPIFATKQPKHKRTLLVLRGSIGWVAKGCLFFLFSLLFLIVSRSDDSARYLMAGATKTAVVKDSLGWDMMNTDSTVADICRGRKLVEFDQQDAKRQWTIVMTVNDGYYDFFQNWYLHFKRLEIKDDTELVLFAEDAHSFAKLTRQFAEEQNVMVVPTHLEKVTGKDEDQAFQFGNWRYVTLVAKRPARMLSVLCTGRNVLYVDADTVWKSNPLVHLHEENDPAATTTSTSSDGYMIVDWKDNKYSHGYNLCTGFMAIQANRYGLEWIRSWEQNLKKKDMNQGIWNTVYSNFYKVHLMEEKLRKRNEEKLDSHIVRPLPSALFPNGREFFETFTQEERDAVVHVHANFIVGHDNKKKKLQEHGLWAVEE